MDTRAPRATSSTEPAGSAGTRRCRGSSAPCPPPGLDVERLRALLAEHDPVEGTRHDNSPDQVFERAA